MRKARPCHTILYFSQRLLILLLLCSMPVIAQAKGSSHQKKAVLYSADSTLQTRNSGSSNSQGSINQRSSQAGNTGSSASSGELQQQVSQILGRDAEVQPGGVIRVPIVRTDILDQSSKPALILAGALTDPKLTLAGNANFYPIGDGRVVFTLELPLFENEVPPFGGILNKGGISVTAIHNHYIFEYPRIIFMHAYAIDDPGKIATVLANALATTQFPGSDPNAGIVSSLDGLDRNTIEGTIGMEGKVMGGVLTIEVPRAESFTLKDVPVPTSIGAESTLGFQPLTNNTRGNTAAVGGEIAVLPSEADAVANVLSTGGFVISAIHDHITTLSPALSYIHFFAVIDPGTAATVIRSALEKTNSKLGNSTGGNNSGSSSGGSSTNGSTGSNSSTGGSSSGNSSGSTGNGTNTSGNNSRSAE